MNKMIFSMFFIFLASCSAMSWVVVNDEREISPGIYKVKLGGNSFSTSKDMLNKLNSYATKVCGKDNYKYSFDRKEEEQMYATGGTFYSMGKPVIEATVTCKK